MTEDDVRAAVSKAIKNRSYSLAIAYVCMVALTLVSILFASHVANSTGQQFCSLIITLDESRPPAGTKLTDQQKIFIEEIAALRRSLHCK